LAEGRLALFFTKGASFVQFRSATTTFADICFNGATLESMDTTSHFALFRLTGREQNASSAGFPNTAGRK
jgi:hypothetical protein